MPFSFPIPGAPTAPIQGMRLAFAAGLLVLLVASTASTQSTDLIDSQSIGSRGVTFVTGGLGPSALVDAAGIGDFDGDGISDVLLASRELGDGDPTKGLALFTVVMGRAGLVGQHLLGGPLEKTLHLRLRDVTTARVGFVHAAADQDQDGFQDALIAMPGYRVPGAGRGRAIVINGSNTLAGDRYLEDIASTVPGTVLFSSDPLHNVNSSTNEIGDFDGNQRVDVAVSVGIGLEGERLRPAVFVRLSDQALPAQVDITTIGRSEPGLIFYLASDDLAVIDLTRAGDVNGDGLTDMLIATGLRVYLLYGRPDPVGPIDAEGLDEGSLASLGTVKFERPVKVKNLTFAQDDQAAGVGDVNGDGFDDILIGVAYSGVIIFDPDPGISVARLFYGRRDFPTVVELDDVPDGLSTAIHPVNQDGFAGDNFARVLAAAGDMNGDGVPDLLVGAPSASPGGREYAGEAYLVFGKRDFGSDYDLASGYVGQRILGAESHSMLGRLLDSAGDFNGDGALDSLVGSPKSFTDPLIPGRAYVLYGSGTSEPPFTVLDMEPAAAPLRGGTEVEIRG